MYTYREYENLHEWSDDIVGGTSAHARRKLKVLRFIRLLVKLNIKSADEFLDLPIFDNNPRYHAYQGPDGRRGITRY